MSRMVRKQIYLEERQEAWLKELARRTGRSEAELIRRAIDKQTPGLTLSRDAIARQAWQQEKAFIQRLIAAGPVPSTERGWTREELYEERLSRYGHRRSG